MTSDEVVRWLESKRNPRNITGMARYGIVSANIYGISVGDLRAFAKSIGKDHALATQLWSTGSHEGRMLAAFIDEPSLVTKRQMNAWAATFDNWALCDTVCFDLFGDTPFAIEKALQWSTSDHEFIKRAAFALIAGLGVHDKKALDATFLAFLPRIEVGALDERNMVKKGVSWALRTIGKRNLALYRRAYAVARRLAASESAAARWVGKDALREFDKPATLTRLEERAARLAKKSARA